VHVQTDRRVVHNYNRQKEERSDYDDEGILHCQKLPIPWHGRMRWRGVALAFFLWLLRRHYLTKQLTVLLITVNQQLVQKHAYCEQRERGITKPRLQRDARCTSAYIYIANCNIRRTEVQYFHCMSDYTQESSTSDRMIKNTQFDATRVNHIDTMPLLCPFPVTWSRFVVSTKLKQVTSLLRFRIFTYIKHVLRIAFERATYLWYYMWKLQKEIIIWYKLKLIKTMKHRNVDATINQRHDIWTS